MSERWQHRDPVDPDTGSRHRRLTNGQGTWSARCVETRTPGAAGGPGRPRELAESEREELARLRRQRTEWAKERAELEMERDVLKRSVVLWVREAMGR
ncbi:hypothetical protein GCM10010404_93650 [Nonomuraea africana]|uniref:Transposase n=1 Tax=Nonomuraea africana TaxID=46171 RepID=A0ABR9K5Z2_9ACTN|nr:hypothetical protein [Nonomuraea africana]MBE1557433.1 transposase [Nonomuraea africana]